MALPPSSRAIPALATRLSPALVVTLLALLGTLTSIVGSRPRSAFGRRRLVAAAMILSILFAAVVGFIGPINYWFAVVTDRLQHGRLARLIFM